MCCHGGQVRTVHETFIYYGCIEVTLKFIVHQVHMDGCNAHDLLLVLDIDASTYFLINFVSIAEPFLYFLRCYILTWALSVTFEPNINACDGPMKGSPSPYSMISLPAMGDFSQSVMFPIPLHRPLSLGGFPDMVLTP